MSLDISVLRYEKSFRDTSELRVHEKGHKKHKVSFWLAITVKKLFVSVAP